MALSVVGGVREPLTPDPAPRTVAPVTPVVATPTPVALAESNPSPARTKVARPASRTPRPTPKPTPQPTPPPTPVTTINGLICSYPWPCNLAVRVACAESTFRPTAVSWAGARGIFQLMPVHADRFAVRGWDYWTDWDAPARNIAVAYDLWADQGWVPWHSSYPWTC